MSVPASSPGQFIDVCAVDDITPDTGVAALIGELQIAIVRVGDGDDQIFALGNYDPFSHAFVIARGIVGDAGGPQDRVAHLQAELRSHERSVPG